MRRGTERRTLALAALAATTLVTLIHLTAPTLFRGVDWLQLHLPARQYLAAALRSGRLPLWNPHVALGRPYLADIEMAVFYPPNLIHLFLDPTVAYVLLTFAHATLAFWGMLRLGRHLRLEPWAGWLCAGLFLSSQTLVARLQSGQTHYVEAMTYIPVIFLLGGRLADRVSGARVLGLAALFGLQILCGHPQIPWLTWVGLGIFVLGRFDWGTGGALAVRRLAASLAALGAAVVGGLALAAPMLLPFLELIGQGNRTPYSMELSGRQGMGAFYWSSLAVPDGGLEVFYWEYNLYTGLAVLVGGLAGLVATWRERDSRGLWLMGAFGALLASGTHTPAFSLFYVLVPGASVFRLPARAAVLVVFALILGLGLFLSRRVRPRVIALGLGLGTFAAGLLFAAYQWRAPDGVATLSLSGRLLWLAVALIPLAGFGLCTTPRRRHLAAAVLAVAIAADVAYAIPPAKAVWSWDVPQEGEPLIHEGLLSRGFYGERGIPPRIAVPPHMARENAATVYGWSGISGFQAVSLARVWVYLHDVLGLSEPRETAYPSSLIFERGPFPYDSMNLVAGLETSRGLVERGAPDPRAYVATAALLVDSWRDAVALMRDGHDFHNVALIEAALEPSLPIEPPEGAAPSAEIETFEAERIVVRTESGWPGVLVLAEAWYPGWEATIDGEAAACVPANAWMRAVRVPAGRHAVVFRFRQRWVGPGVGLATVAFLMLAGWAWRDRHDHDATE